MATGTIKRFNDSLGYGWITPDEAGPADVFLHHEQITTGEELLLVGQAVEYEAVNSVDNVPHAISCKKI